MSKKDFSFELIAQKGKARLGKIKTGRGIINTPAFMPVGTLGTVKGIFTEDVEKTNSEIRNPDGTIVFKLENIEVPENWSQVAADVLAQKYFRKAGIPACLKKNKEKFEKAKGRTKTKESKGSKYIYIYI